MRVPGPWAVTIALNSSSNWTIGTVNYNVNGIFLINGSAIAAGQVVLNVNFNTGATAEL